MDTHPLTLDPDLERTLAGEDAAQRAILQGLRDIQEVTWRDYGHAQRAVHAKSHALLQGTLTVPGDLPPPLAQGMFARPGTYPVVLRISTNPGDVLDDAISAPRGLAMKVIGVEGERLPSAEAAPTQDFVMAAAPAFVAPDARAFAASLKLLALTTDTGQGWKKLLSALLQVTVAAGLRAGLPVARLKALGGQPPTHPLGETFYTQTPYRYGSEVAKLSLAPADGGLRALRGRRLRLGGRPNGIRAAMIAHFAGHGGRWELRVQRRTDPARMPIEDASVPWPEALSPFETVAVLEVGPQPAWSEARAQAVDDALAFSPWNGIVAHRPLGSVNRARRLAYAASAAFRSARNGCPLAAPAEAPVLSGAPASADGEAPGRDGRRPGTRDARPGAWSQPVRPAARGVALAVLAGLGCGAAVMVLRWRRRS